VILIAILSFALGAQVTFWALKSFIGDLIDRLADHDAE
jgi:hypothetical protein